MHITRGQIQGEGGDPPVRQIAPPAQGMPGYKEGHHPRQEADREAEDGPLAPSSQGLNQEEGRDPPRQSALLEHGMPEREGGIPQSRRAEDEDGASPEQPALLAHGMHGKGDPRLHTTRTQRGPPEQRVPQAHGMQEGGGGMGKYLSQKGRGGHNPNSRAHHLCTV